MNYSSSFQTMLTYLHEQLDCKIARALTKYSVNCTTDEVNYLTMRGGMVSFLPAGKEHKVNDDGKWSRDGRQDGKPARVIRKVITQVLIDHLDIKDSDYEKFSNLVASYVGVHGDGDGGSDPKFTMVVCNGGLIPLYYANDQYSSHAGGNLTGSCMRHVDSDFFDIYMDNPDRISMAVCIDNDHRVVGRALIWNTDSTGLCMDTIYASENIQPIFTDFAIRNGMRYKSSQSCHHHDFDMMHGRHLGGGSNVSVTLRNWDHSYYPYMDSLRFLCEDTGRLCNFTPSGDYRTLRDTDGSWESSSSRVECIVTGDMIHEDDAIHLDYRRSSGRWVEGYTHQDRCVDTYEGWRLEDDAVYVPSRGEHFSIDSEYIVYVEYHSEYYHVDDIVFDVNGDAIPYDDAVELHDGEYALIDDCVQLTDGRWALESDTVSDKTDKTLNKHYLINSYSDVETKEVYND